jgi:endonuclease III
MPKKSKPKPIHHASDYGLDVMEGEDELFRWFLLVYLFGKPIQASVAAQTWKLFMDRKLDTPWAILQTPHRRLVNLLDEGKYKRYDETTARGLHTCMEQLIRDYEGSFMMMIDNATNEDELSKRLQALHGVGPKTAEIFMRETQEFFARRVE